MDVLQTLINSLTKAEKRYFKMFAAAFKTESELVKLFDTLDTDKELNDAEIQKKAGLKNIAAARSNLRKLILKAMRNYREGNSPKQQMRDTLSDIDFLITKRLFTEAKKEINKARKVAEQEENYIYLLQLAVAEGHTLQPSIKPERLTKEIADLRNEIQVSARGAAEIAEAILLQKAVTTYAKSIDFDNLEARINKGNLFAEEALCLRDKNTVAYAKLININTVAMCYSHISARYEDANDISDEIYHQFNKNQQLKQIAVEMYLPFIINYANANANRSHYSAEKTKGIIDEASLMFDNYKDYFTGRPDLKFEFQQRISFVKLTYNMYWSTTTYSFDDIEDTIKEHINGQEFPRIEALASLQVSLLIALLVSCKQAAKAIEWLPVYFSLDDAKLLKPVAFVTRLNEVLAYYFNRDMDIADTKANNLYKTMHEQGMLKSDYHNTVGKLLRKLCKWNLNEIKDRKELEDIIQEFKKYCREDNEFDGLYAGFFNAPVLTQLIAEHKA